MTSTSQGNRRARPRWRRGLMISAQLLLGLGLGAVIAEIAFMQRDDGAFPHVNFYVPDPELGVRLEPGATMRFQLRWNPLSTIHVNSRGFRGPDWPAAADNEVIVVGDSQVFGLGVEDDATFSAGLAGRSGRPVLNAGVPTYGPQEYLATARELLAERRAKVVVVALNFVNDPFEIDRPNRERHAVWDGWAVRSETAPAEVAQFPGRRWLFSRSHAVYALRRWLHERGTAKAPESVELGDPVDLGTPSEGGLHDLVSASQSARAGVSSAQQEAMKQLAASQQRAQSIGFNSVHGLAPLPAAWPLADHALGHGMPARIQTDQPRESPGPRPAPCSYKRDGAVEALASAFACHLQRASRSLAWRPWAPAGPAASAGSGSGVEGWLWWLSRLCG